jgi:hypothetical protein
MAPLYWQRFTDTPTLTSRTRLGLILTRRTRLGLILTSRTRLGLDENLGSDFDYGVASQEQQTK